MKSFTLATVLILAAAPALRAQTAPPPPFYIQPSFVVAFPGSNLKTAPGGDLALGFNFLPHQALEADVTAFQSQISNEIAPPKVNFTQLLGTYKVEIPATPTVSFHLGAFLGATFEQTKGYGIVGSNGLLPSYYEYNESDTAFTYGGMADLTCRLSSMLALVVGGRLSELSATTVTSRGFMTLINLGLNIRF